MTLSRRGVYLLPQFDCLADTFQPDAAQTPPPPNQQPARLINASSLKISERREVDGRVHRSESWFRSVDFSTQLTVKLL